MCCSALITQNPKGIYEAARFFFFCSTAVKASLLRLLLGVCSGSWTDTHTHPHTHGCHRKELISNPAVGETWRLFSPRLLPSPLICNSDLLQLENSERRERLTSAPPRSGITPWLRRTTPVLFAPPAMTRWGCTQGERGAFTAYIPVAELLKSPPVIHSRFLFYS